MENEIFWIITLSFFSSCAYRLGGISRPFRSWMRDWIIPGIVIAAMIFVLKIKAPWWAYLLSYLLIGAALTTYWDDLFNNEDNFFAHGGMIGLGLLPLVLAGSITWISFLSYTAILSLTMGLWCKIFSNDWMEELFRGGIIIITLPILLI